MKIYALLLILTLVSCKKYKLEEDDVPIRVYTQGNGVTDIDGNSYKTVIIGEQEWMAENLKVTKLNDGTPISKYVGGFWQEIPYYTWTNNDSTYDSIFGKLYTTLVIDKNVCPVGWKIPKNEDWSQLIDYLGSHLVAGKRMKSTGTIEENNGLWFSYPNNSNDETGFNVIPCGNDSLTIYKYAYFWSASLDPVYGSKTPVAPNYSYFELNHSDDKIIRKNANKSYEMHRFSIRCLKE